MINYNNTGFSEVLNLKKHLTFVCILFSMLLLTGCEKQVCSYCGETKYCDTYKILDTERYICKECKDNPDVTVSGNVVNEYQAEPLDDSLFGVGSDRHKKSEVSENSVDEQTSDQISQEENNTPNTSVTNTDNSQASDTDNNTSSSAQSQSSSYDSREDIISRLAPLLASSALQLAPSPDSKKIYTITKTDGTDAGITLTFDTNSSGKLTLNVAKSTDGDNTSYTNTCISTALAFINMDDYNQTGYEIFNNACQYGNYTKNGCRFYYMDNSDGSNPAAEFDISFQ